MTSEPHSEQIACCHKQINQISQCVCTSISWPDSKNKKKPKKFRNANSFYLSNLRPLDGSVCGEPLDDSVYVKYIRNYNKRVLLTF